jgi:hypothetical protein
MRLNNHPNYWLRDDAAASFNRLEARVGIIPVNSAGRTEAEQTALIKRWDRGGAANRPPYLYSPQRPASASSHVKNGGEAIDTSAIASMLTHGGEHGWVQVTKSDPVHFVYVPAQDKHRGGTVVPSAGPVEANPYGLTDVRGLQKIAKRYGYTGDIDNKWGPKSRAGFDAFLRSQGGLAAWLRRRWGYVGNDVFGPVMRAALRRANDENFRVL